MAMSDDARVLEAFIAADAPEVRAFIRHAEAHLRQPAPKKRCREVATGEAARRWSEAETRATQLLALCGLPYPRNAIEAARGREKRAHAAAIAADPQLRVLLEDAA